MRHWPLCFTLLPVTEARGRAGGQASLPDLFVAETSLFSETVPNSAILGQSVKLGNIFLWHLPLFLLSALSVPHER